MAPGLGRPPPRPRAALGVPGMSLDCCPGLLLQDSRRTCRTLHLSCQSVAAILPTGGQCAAGAPVCACVPDRYQPPRASPPPRPTPPRRPRPAPAAPSTRMGVVGRRRRSSGNQQIKRGAVDKVRFATIILCTYSSHRSASYTFHEISSRLPTKLHYQDKI